MLSERFAEKTSLTLHETEIGCSIIESKPLKVNFRLSFETVGGKSDH